MLDIVLKDLDKPFKVQEAKLLGYELKRAAGEDFPILIQCNEMGGHASGSIFTGICSEGRERLIYFEGEEYNLEKIKIEGQDVWCFISSELGYEVDGEWDFKTWQQSRDNYEVYLRQVRDYMAYFGRAEKFIWKS